MSLPVPNSQPPSTASSPAQHGDQKPKVNLLITGGRGGIGLALLQAVASEPDISAVSLARSGLLEGCVLPANTRHEVGSVLDERFLKRIIEHHQITHIIHAAGARTLACEADPDLAFESNVLGTERLFHAAQASDTVRKVVYFSTAALYGRTDQCINETQPHALSSNYAKSKATAEEVVFGCTAGSKFQSVIVRPAFVIGPQTSGALNAFVRDAVRQPECNLHWVERFHLHWAPDLAEATLRLLRAELPAKTEVFHLPGRDCTIHEWVSAVCQGTASHGFHPRVSISLDDSSRQPATLDYSRFERAIGPLAQTALSEMIGRLIDHERSS